MDSPKTIYADFSRRWKFVDGSTTQVTDGNFVLLLAENNTALGNGSNTAGNALLAGGGNLDLTNLEAETGVAIKTIGRNSFNSCTSLRSVILPETVTTLREFTFTGCSALTNMVLSSHVETIGENFVSNCPELRSLSPALPSSLRSLGYRAFYRTTALKIDIKLSCPEMTSLPRGLFHGSGITSLDLSESGITTIARDCAVDATSLTNVVFSPGIESIGEQFAYNATSLRTVTPFLPDTVRHIGWSSFRNTNLTGDLRLANPNGVTLETDTFRDSKITSADFSASGNTNIAARTFLGCTELASVKLPLRLTTVETFAFYDCKNLRTVDPFLPRHVTTLGDEAFSGCTSITNDLVLRCDTLTTIPYRSFRNVPLKNVTLPKQALTFGRDAFSGCAPNAAFWFYGEAPASVNTYVFYTGSTANPAILYAPRKLDAEGWAAVTTELTDSDRAKASYPGPATFGVFVESGYRHWLVNWNPPLASGPAVMTVQ